MSIQGSGKVNEETLEVATRPSWSWHKLVKIRCSGPPGQHGESQVVGTDNKYSHRNNHCKNIHSLNYKN